MKNVQTFIFRGQLFLFMMLSAIFTFQYEVLMMERGVPLSTSLSIFGVSQVLSMASIFIWGKIVQRARHVNRLIQGTLIVRIAILLFMYLSGNQGAFIVLFLMYSTIWGSIDVVFEGRLTQWVYNNGLSFGKFRLWGSIGWALSGFTVTALYLFIETSNSILLFLLAINVFILIGSLKYPLQVEANKSSHKKQRLDKKYVVLLILAAIVFILPDSFGIVLNNHYRETFGLTVERAVFYTGIALIFGAFISEVPALLVVDRLIRRFGPKKIIMAGMVLSCLRWLFAVIANQTPLWFTFNFLFHGVVFAFIYVGTLSYVQDQVGNEATSAIVINFTLIAGIVGFIKTQLLSLILNFHSTNVVLIGFIGISLVMTGLFWGLFYRRD